ncbi:BTB/POZ domain-containing protein POB1 [Linum perenne]
MIEESAAGDETPTGSEYGGRMGCSTVLRVNTIYISSPILAAKSPFFYKLFSNGMRESDQRHVTLRIHESEAAALMELLNFMYSNTVSTNTPTALLDVLMAADKFEVVSCMRYCSRLLRNSPMTSDSALLYLDLPSTVLLAEAVQPLTDAAKQYLAGRYKDMSKFQEEALNLPLAGIEAVLSSDDLQVASEDAVYDFVLKWARTHYPRLEERREVLATRFVQLIRFPFMSSRKLKKVLTCNDFDREIASKVVLDALFFKNETPHRRRALAAEEASSTCRRFVERSYKYRPVKVMEFEVPRQQCLVYLDLKRDECKQLHPSGRVYSQAFHLGGQGFFLSAHCNIDQQGSFHCFGLFLGMQEKGSLSFAVDYEFAARTKPAEEFVSKYKGNYTFTGGKAVGYRNLFAVPWATFIAEDSPFFINNILHLRAELTMKQEK